MIKQPHHTFFAITPQHLSSVATFIFFFMVLGYLTVHFVWFFFTPEISIHNPRSLAAESISGVLARENTIVREASLTIEGKVTFASLLTLNGDEVYIEENGFFRKELLLVEGVNLVALEAENWFGRKAKVAKSVVYIQS